MKTWLVDAFAKQAYQGNPATIILVDEFPNDTNCHNIALETNSPMTAFIKPKEQHAFYIRWFSSVGEVKLCGHATLAASHIIFQENLVSGNEVVFHSNSQVLKGYKTIDGITLNFPIIPITRQLDKQDIENHLQTAIKQAVQVSDMVVAELADEQEIYQFKPIANHILAIDCRALIITAKSQQYDFVSRVFGPRKGILEDPVTGSAHCVLADYWRTRLNKTDFLAYQASSRSGILKLAIKENNTVNITGSAITLMQGNWLLNED